MWQLSNYLTKVPNLGSRLYLGLVGGVMNIKWDYSYYQLWSDNEWLVDKMLVMLDEDITM